MPRLDGHPLRDTGRPLITAMIITGTYTSLRRPKRSGTCCWTRRRSLPACPAATRSRPIGENKYRAAMTMGIAAVTGRYQGTVEMTDLDPPRSYRLVVEGRGKPGFVNGGGTITLTAHEGGTLATIDGTVQVGGTIARFGQRLLGGVSRMTMDRFLRLPAAAARRVVATPKRRIASSPACSSGSPACKRLILTKVDGQNISPGMIQPR